MPNPSDVARLLPLVREYGTLERKRTTNGFTPLEYQRWSELQFLLETKFPQGLRPKGAERRKNLRLPTKILVEYDDQGELRDALIRNISRGGLFVATETRPEVGTELNLSIRVGNDERVELPVVVVCTGAPGPQKTRGIGCKFAQLTSEQQDIVDEMFATALESER